ncbi:unnamed protein product [Mycena citricolor]|uniref:histone acetyltransferase n=1 Tax=Mycena citricolor TaxID=2018698 RepID=A0AAD2Q4T6_9AGAR|nr:unnamed protein product [Mycena citricolor]
MPATHVVTLPAALPSGTVLKNGAEQHAQIMNRREGQVYVHYVDRDKRMDEWIDENLFVPATNDSASRRSNSGDSPSPDTPMDRVERTVVMSEEDYDLEHHKKITAQRNIDKVNYGDWQIRTWYFSPYPLAEHEDQELSALTNAVNGHANNTNVLTAARIPRHGTVRSHTRVLDLFAGGQTRSETPLLWVCQYCFKYMTDVALYEKHKCNLKHPPGRKVYARGAHTIWEVDGAVHKLYCQNLTLFGKLFIDTKTLFFDCDNFLFYMMTDAESSTKDNVIGFFSKEKASYDDYNLACIITLPPWQRKGYGMLMIEFSYELSRRAGKFGTPERPLSDLGLRSYLAYWVATLIRFFRRVLQVLPPNTKYVGPLRAMSREVDEEEGSPAIPNSGNSVTPSASTGFKRKRRPKGYGGEEPNFLEPSSYSEDADFVSRFRTFAITPKEDGSATMHVVLRCTLEDLAKATNLRIDDAAFALNEVGFLAMRLSYDDEDQLKQSLKAEATSDSEPTDKFVYISKEIVDRIAAERKVKPPCLQIHSFLSQSKDLIHTTTMSDAQWSFSQTFASQFQNARTELESRIASATAASVDDLSIDLAKFTKMLGEAVGSLPTYEQRQYESKIKELEKSLQLLRDSRPKSKFAFKRKAAVAGTPSHSSAVPVPSSSPAPVEAVSTTSSNSITSQSHKYITKSALASASQSSDLIVSELSWCIVNLLSESTGDGGFSAIHVQNLSDTILLLPLVSGSVLVHDLTRCIVVVGSHQFRMHSSSNVDVYLHTATPIIEHCTGIRFAPYPSSFAPDSVVHPLAVKALWTQPLATDTTDRIRDITTAMQAMLAADIQTPDITMPDMTATTTAVQPAMLAADATTTWELEQALEWAQVLALATQHRSRRCRNGGRQPGWHRYGRRGIRYCNWSNAPPATGGGAMVGKMEHALGTLVGSQSLKAKGLQKEQEAKAYKVQSSELNRAEALEQEALARRDRAVGFGAHPDHRHLGGQAPGAGVGDAFSGTNANNNGRYL